MDDGIFDVSKERLCEGAMKVSLREISVSPVFCLGNCALGAIPDIGICFQSRWSSANLPKREVSLPLLSQWAIDVPNQGQ